MIRTNKKEVILNMVYSLGAAVVILGALCKINHLSFGPLTGSWILGIGLVVEAFIFVVFAFDPPKAEYEWEKVYPELGDESLKSTPRKLLQDEDQIKEAQLLLSQKLDKMLQDARVDAGLFERLRGGIENFSRSVEDINKIGNVSFVTEKYGNEMETAINKLREMNNNINNLNKVYGGMLNAMKNNN